MCKLGCSHDATCLSGNGDWVLAEEMSEQSKKRGVERLSFLPIAPWRNLAYGGAGGDRARTAGVHADHTGLVGEVHVLSGGGRGDRRSRNRVRLVAVAWGEQEGVPALGAGRQHGVNQVR